VRLIKGKKYSYSDSSPGEKFLPKGLRRKLARDYEPLPQTLAGLHYLVFAILMLKNVAAILA
jgi:hypothetical protein